MIELHLRRAESKAERLELGDGHMANWIPQAIQVGGAIIGGLLGRKGAKDQAKDIEKANADQLKYQGLPRWDDRQTPYVFGQGKQWQMPYMNAQAINYMQGLSGGYNPMYGPQLAGLLGGAGGPMQPTGGGATLGSGGFQGGNQPWFMNPQSNPFDPGIYGGLAGMLGIGQGAPPPLFMNDPRFGYNVANPNDLMGTLPGQTGGGAAPDILNPPAPDPVQAPVQAQAPRGWNPFQTETDALAYAIRTGNDPAGLDFEVARRTVPKNERYKIVDALRSTERFNRIMQDMRG